MKKLTLDKTWEQCLIMWQWIVRQPCPRDISWLKQKWLKKYGFNDICCDCFFCEHDNHRTCTCCPGYKVDKNFNCGNKEYDYHSKPAAFLRKLNELNKKRLAKGRKR